MENVIDTTHNILTRWRVIFLPFFFRLLFFLFLLEFITLSVKIFYYLHQML